MSTSKRERSCRGRTADGEPCGSPVVGDDGYCPAHRPGGRERMAELGREGGIAAHEADSHDDGLDPDELPPLDSHEHAELWLERVGRAVAAGSLEQRSANAAIRAVEAWADIRAEGEAVQELEELAQKVREIEEKQDERPW